jgi:hypothetical protein
MRRKRPCAHEAVLAQRAGGEQRSRLIHRVARAKLRVLRDEVAGGGVAAERLAHQFGHVANHQHHILRACIP